jgi:hypothetical protein
MVLVPAELLERPDALLERLDLDATAEMLGLPAEELRLQLT